MSQPLTTDHTPVTFHATNCEASRDGDVLKFEIQSGVLGVIRIVYECEPEMAMDFARHIKKAYKQWRVAQG